ncbi:hypothetical protein OUZ56_004935 [Daphnia magna]|uniref:Nuclear receptor domain-containing protein n=1 Tax=Daphnia magna TaxID=35525 RepID=A0ABQ9YRB3_9CRUS|nr:hypothetical protein OUZ56_004935 [Daphnia magna]
MIGGAMNQLCKVCGEPAAGFHFGAFTCEGCKFGTLLGMRRRNGSLLPRWLSHSHPFADEVEKPLRSSQQLTIGAKLRGTFFDDFLLVERYCRALY